jgi:hypothetical protein
MRKTLIAMTAVLVGVKDTRFRSIVVGDRRAGRISIAILVFAAASLTALVGPANPAGATVQTVTPTLLGSILATEESSTYEVSRDVGDSVLLPNNKSLWDFGDTDEYSDATGTWVQSPPGSISGSTAAEGDSSPGTAPSGLGEVVVGSKSTGSTPSRFIPPPTDVYNPDPSVGGSCTRGASSDGTNIAYPARWPNGLAMLNGTDILVSYTDVCVLDGGNAITEGWGFMEMNHNTHDIKVGPDDVIPPQPPSKTFGDDQLAPQYHFGSPVVRSGKVTFNSATCSGYYDGVCDGGNVWSLTVKAATKDLKYASNYTDPTPATTTDDTSWTPSSDDAGVNYYPGVGYMMTELTSIYGSFDIYSSDDPSGPWTEIASGDLPDCFPAPGSGFCYALVGHPELSDSSEMEISYVVPGYGPDPAANHLVAARIPIPG